ncbi:hypothetical protein [Paenibacillus macerans]|uniref:hypothetical protein n=1 Tax=Paenibacillus macerans TaxID=44252 RepID=UPI00203D5778|nr:hypothetical protein [Paenibacillus macerans]MCM3704057.1 hypothetical protein [Paenibacillus macerans]
MKARVNKPMKHSFMDIHLPLGMELEVDGRKTILGMVKIILPEEYADMYISVDDIDLVKEANQ